MPPPYKRIIIRLDVQDYMAQQLAHLPDVQDCLIDAFKQLKRGEIAYGPDIIEPMHFAVDRCRHTILFSINERTDTLYITQLIYPARNTLRGILY
jgi:hypothetical protein